MPTGPEETSWFGNEIKVKTGREDEKRCFGAQIFIVKKNSTQVIESMVMKTDFDGVNVFY